MNPGTLSKRNDFHTAMRVGIYLALGQFVAGILFTGPYFGRPEPPPESLNLIFGGPGWLIIPHIFPNLLDIRTFIAMVVLNAAVYSALVFLGLRIGIY